ncbi:ubiquitin-like-conjugating enzyme ATG10 [Microplitis mediator]|uniref:ubiquitin-like-conjugating enzyme ATG10 n=1 Tax=Microplitis mediator TaxID=375433 RepID=UPI002553E775|nr:ubiquitin-like-conjugating enzyme ATG10 [Microplitis mediator]XP_057324552.1 ubiquitin-like-conjugating enzyme ATG10 [Microplitis mediator]
MDGPGTITWEEFFENAKSFARVSDEIFDSWELRGDKDVPAQAYLVRRVKTFVSRDYLNCKDNVDFKKNLIKTNGDDDNDDGDIYDDPFEAKNNLDVPFITEHHVLWSMSYSVPILFFNGWMSDFPGVNPVSVELAQKLVRDNDTSLGYNELSQAIHPILGTTFLQLHPCMSKELIQSTSKSKNKLVSWLSAVSPAALNLKIKNEYFKLTNPDD